MQLQSVVPVSNAGQSIPTHTPGRTPACPMYTFWEGKGLVTLLLDVNARVARVGVDDQRPGGGETLCVLVENDVTLILDELFEQCQ